MPDRELRTTYTRSDAERAGLTRAQLRDDGRRISRGVYVSAARALTVRSACEALSAALPAPAAFGDLTAAALLGAPVPHTWPLHVVVPPGARRPRRARVVARVRDLLPADRALIGGLPVTSAAQTWLDLAAHLPSAELVAVGDALWRAGHLDGTTLQERLARADGVRGVIRARTWAPRLTPKSASRPESLLRVHLIEGDVPDPEPQVPLSDRRGREVVHADLGYRRWRVAVEYEGRQHAELRQFRADIDRYTLMAADGWLLLRFGDVHLARPWTVVDRVARALRSRGARW
ncbi:hypothetical protein [Modestobacter sp. SYSU DS0875]